MEGEWDGIAVVVNADLYRLGTDVEAGRNTLSEVQYFLPVLDANAARWVQGEYDVGHVTTFVICVRHTSQMF